MILIVDTNILISALINSYGTEFQILKKNYKSIDFISTTYLKSEFEQKLTKIASFTTLSFKDILFQYTSLIEQFIFIDENLFDRKLIDKTTELMKGLDSKDYLFVAATLYFDGLLWTGDLKLKRGLNRKNFRQVITTSELKEIIQGL